MKEFGHCFSTFISETFSPYFFLYSVEIILFAINISKADSLNEIILIFSNAHLLFLSSIILGTTISIVTKRPNFPCQFISILTIIALYIFQKSLIFATFLMAVSSFTVLFEQINNTFELLISVGIGGFLYFSRNNIVLLYNLLIFLIFVPVILKKIKLNEYLFKLFQSCGFFAFDYFSKKKIKFALLINLCFQYLSFLLNKSN